VIGLATATSPTGPWKESAIVVSTRDDNTAGTNAIDPTVLIDQSGQHYMYYGSAWDGIYILKLDPATGLSASPGQRGKRIAQRGFTGSSINGNIEGPDIIYNKELNKYFLFISYDWLETKYNVRVGRADSPEGPFLDYFGNDINTEMDHKPMIIAPYQFQGHGGWQGTSHMSVFENGGQYYIAHQGRPGVNKYFMDLHVRKLYWNKEGWPVASPERYAAVESSAVSQTELMGNWEYIVLNYRVVPGYAAEQITPDFQVAINLKLGENGSINDDASSTWKYEAPYLELNWSNGTIDKVMVDRERDWENKITSTLIFTGLNQEGTAVWGKKKQ
jgi:arabinan endo-1,5-alpha-L-arabinosidase